jgi:hypothetical protein
MAFIGDTLDGCCLIYYRVDARWHSAHEGTERSAKGQGPGQR